MPLEIEAKFAVSHLGEIRRRLLDRGARLIRDRVLERNWRFDNPEGTLTTEGKVLRLRQDAICTLTFKQPESDPLIRTEIEFEVDEPEQASHFLRALGYEVIFIYEKYRETFSLQGTSIVLDELPFGHFIEIEGASIDDLRQTAQEMGLAWPRRLDMSYSDLFKHWQEQNDSQLRDATFRAFQDFDPVRLADLDLPDALTMPAGPD